MKPSKTIAFGLLLMSALFARFALPASAQSGASQPGSASVTGSGLAAEGQSLQAMEAAGVKVSFDVVSVKVNTSGGGSHSNVPFGPGDPFSRTGGLFTVANMPLPPIIAWAFDLSGDQQLRVNSELPKWALADRFDIEAKAAGNPGKAEMELMVQSLLADRFKLVTHMETKEGPIFALEMVKPGKLGPQLKPHVSDPSCSGSSSESGAAASPACASGLRQAPPSAPGLIRFVGQDVSVSIIAKYLPLTSAYSGIDRPVIDRTGLTGNYDFSIEFSPRSGIAPARDGAASDTGPTVIEALRDQVGLRLESETGPASALVIDRIEEPSAN